MAKHCFHYRSIYKPDKIPEHYAHCCYCNRITTEAECIPDPKHGKWNMEDFTYRVSKEVADEECELQGKDKLSLEETKKKEGE